jgi:hypothetical protein
MYSQFTPILSCRFKQYAGMVQDTLMPQYGASWHWAKQDTDPTCVILLLCHRFKEYAGMVQDSLMPQYGASWHWAKIEVPEDPPRLAAMRAALAERFPLQRFNAYRCV